MKFNDAPYNAYIIRRKCVGLDAMLNTRIYGKYYYKLLLNEKLCSLPTGSVRTIYPQSALIYTYRQNFVVTMSVLNRPGIAWATLYTIYTYLNKNNNFTQKNEIHSCFFLGGFSILYIIQICIARVIPTIEFIGFISIVA